MKSVLLTIALATIASASNQEQTGAIAKLKNGVEVPVSMGSHLNSAPVMFVGSGDVAYYGKAFGNLQSERLFVDINKKCIRGNSCQAVHMYAADPENVKIPGVKGKIHTDAASVFTDKNVSLPEFYSKMVSTMTPIIKVEGGVKALMVQYPETKQKNETSTMIKAVTSGTFTYDFYHTKNNNPNDCIVARGTDGYEYLLKPSKFELSKDKTSARMMFTVIGRKCDNVNNKPHGDAYVIGEDGKEGILVSVDNAKATMLSARVVTVVWTENSKK